VLVPGQRITDNIVDYLIRYLRVQNKVELHGVAYQGYFPSVRVLTAAEEQRLAPLLTRRAGRKAA
jgi:arginine/lysine/ornithine decarboxylase